MSVFSLLAGFVLGFLTAVVFFMWDSQFRGEQDKKREIDGVS